MDFFTAVKKRRSVRKYKNKDVSDGLIEKIISAGSLAPSGGNMQPWEFIVVRDKDNINKIVDTTFLGFDRESTRRQDWLRDAPILIVICADYKRTMARYGEMGKKIALLDTAAAIENMLLAITALNLGSCWVSGFDSEELKKVIEITGQIEPVAILPVGYPEQIPQSPNKFNFNEIVHYEKFGNTKF